MLYRRRLLEATMQAALQRGKSVLLLGARQTGKSTLAQRFPHALAVNFMRASALRKYSARPELLEQEIAALPRATGQLPLVFLDEVQRLPACLDVAQDAIDRHLAQFILSGSSARQLRRAPKVNLLPGRLTWLRLDPFMWAENNTATLPELLQHGSLPGIATQTAATQIDTDLNDYVASYLQEEIRAEALVRNLGSFSRFLELASLESGNVINFSKISADLGLGIKSIKNYYEIMEDCLMLERIEPISSSNTRKKLTKSPKYLIFDLGVRRACAGEGAITHPERWGKVFEQWVGLELCRYARYLGPPHRVSFWRDPNGPEVDWVIRRPDSLIPIEVKWDVAPTQADAAHLRLFMAEYPQAQRAYIICRASLPFNLDHNIQALPWQNLAQVWSAAPAAQ